MADDWAWQRLSDLTDGIGPRLAGSAQLELATRQIADAMRELGAQVRLQPAKVPHWVRGAEQAQLIDYPGRPAGNVQQLRVTALGNSGATPDQGLDARVLTVSSFAELDQRAAEVPGAIVVFTARFDQRLADAGQSGPAYGENGLFRFQGPARAARLGAAAVLVRSVGGAELRLPHTGVTHFDDGQAPVPAGALAAEDADLIARHALRGPVRMHLQLTPQTLPDADSANVIADWPGREQPEQVVLVSGHLDSWDPGTGASDDGTGVAAAAGALHVLQSLGLHPRRTIRFVAWTSEEFGSQGARAYMAAEKPNAARHVAAIESDSGAGHMMGIQLAVAHADLARLEPVAQALAPIGAQVLNVRTGELGADIADLQRLGVPGFAPLVDTRHYFDIHHTAADTLDKVSPAELRAQVAGLAVLAWVLAEMDAPLARYTVPAD